MIWSRLNVKLKIHIKKFENITLLNSLSDIKKKIESKLDLIDDYIMTKKRLDDYNFRNERLDYIHSIKSKYSSIKEKKYLGINFLIFNYTNSINTPTILSNNYWDDINHIRYQVKSKSDEWDLLKNFFFNS